MIKKTDSRIYAFLRIAFGILALVLVSDYYSRLDFHFASNSWSSYDDIQTLQRSVGFNLFYFSDNLAFVKTAYAFLVVSLVAVVIGFYSRASLIVACILMMSFYDRARLIMDGDEIYIRMVLFLLIFTRCDERWSLSKLIKRKSHIQTFDIGWPVFLLQVQLCLIYFSNGITKLLGAMWVNGTAFKTVLLNPVFARFDFSSVIASPAVELVLNFISRATPWFEIGLGFAFLSKKTRKLAVVFGVAFHIATFVCMDLRFFPWIMICWYVVYYKPNSNEASKRYV